MDTNERGNAAYKIAKGRKRSREDVMGVPAIRDEDDRILTDKRQKMKRLRR